MSDVIRTADERLNDTEQAQLYEYCRPHPTMYRLIRRLVSHGVVPDPPLVDEPPRIFSGDYSREMWAKINAIQYEPVQEALYLLGCRLQELEARLEQKS